MSKGKGFDKLRRATVASALGLGFFGGIGTARAATVATPAAIAITTGSQRHYWGGYGSATPAGSGLGNISWAFNPATTTAWASSSAFGIADASIQVSASAALTDAYDAAFNMAVDGVAYANPGGQVDITDQVVTTSTVSLSGLDAHIEMAFGVSQPGVLRAMYVFHNPSSATIDAEVRIGGNLGSDSGTTMQGTSNGTKTFDQDVMWYVSNDNTTADGNPIYDPTFTLCRFGTGAAVKPTALSVPGTTDGMGYTDNFIEQFLISVPAGETRRILLFTEMNAVTADAIANAAACETRQSITDAGLLAGLTEEELLQVVNFSLADAVAKKKRNNDGGALSPFTALSLAGLGMLSVLRRRKKQH